MTTTPKVSILIPCYNSERFIAETLDSCLAQTYSNIEIIIVDDGSTDRSLVIAKDYERNDERVNVICQSNAGACAARNNAFAHSTGDYVVFLDADDLINETFIEEHVNHISISDGKSVCFCRWGNFNKLVTDAKIPDLKIYKDYNEAFQLLLDLWTEGMLQTTCYMTPRQLVADAGYWNEAVLLNQDGEFFSRILIHASQALFVSGAKVYYRKGEYTSVSKPDNPRKIASLLSTFMNYKKNALAHEDSIRVRKGLAIIFTSFIYVYGNRFPELCRQAKVELNCLKMGYILERVPERVKVISKLIGFDNFMLIRKLLIKR